LRDYRAAGRGKVKLVFVDPQADTAGLREARSLGIPAVQFNVLGRSELQVKEGYIGIAIRYADGVKTVPFVQQSNDLEYRLTSDIRSLTHADKPAIALGEISDPVSMRGQRSFSGLREQLERTYAVRSFTLTDTAIADSVRVIAVAGAPDSLTRPQLARLRGFLNRGGSLLVMAGGMQLSAQGQPFATSRLVGWNELLGVQRSGRYPRAVRPSARPLPAVAAGDQHQGVPGERGPRRDAAALGEPARYDARAAGYRDPAPGHEPGGRRPGDHGDDRPGTGVRP